MRNKKIFFILILILILPIHCFAFFCPNTFNQINYGDTIAQVQQQCGKPASQNEKEIQKEGPQEWSYYISQTVSSNSLTPMQGTLKTSFTFDADGKAINISVNGIGVGSTTICGNNVQLGDTRDAVKTACGSPAFVNKQSNQSNGKEEAGNKLTILNYKSSPPVSLTFENGKLIGKD